MKIKENIPAMFPQGSEWGASQLMQENMVLALYASASTNDRVSRGITLMELLFHEVNTTS